MADMGTPPPFDIQGEILKRVPEVKSLLRFRSVSKSWKCLIDSPQFIAGYQPHPPRHHVFICYADYTYERFNYISITHNDDDDSHSFTEHKFQSLGVFKVGSSKGLFCFCYSNGIAIMWNPSIRKSVTIDVPKVSSAFTMGFGVSPYSNDPKLVTIQRDVDPLDELKPRLVELYSLSTGEWRTLSEDLPRSSVAFDYVRHVAIGNFIFWLAYEKATGMKREMIIIFDMISEKFMEIYLPDHVVTEKGPPYNKLSLCKLRESLAVVASYYNYSVNKQFVHVWMMEGGVSASFTKMYSIIRPDAARFSLLAFRNNGHPIIQVSNDDKFKGSNELVVYEPDSEQFTLIGPSPRAYTLYASYYMETLLLLDH